MFMSLQESHETGDQAALGSMLGDGGFSNFFLRALSAMNFYLSTTFIASCKFGYAVSSFSLNSMKS